MTRADFYVGKGAKAEWIGSIAADGYPENTALHDIFQSRNSRAFRARVAAYIIGHSDYATRPDQGWPWPWPDSSTSDYSYWFFRKGVWVADEDWGYLDALRKRENIEYPDMTDKKSVTLGSRSGLIVIGKVEAAP